MSWWKKWWGAVKENVTLREKVIELERQLEASEWLYAQAVSRHEERKKATEELMITREQMRRCIYHLTQESRKVLQYTRCADGEAHVVVLNWKDAIYRAEDLIRAPLHIESIKLP